VVHELKILFYLHTWHQSICNIFNTVVLFEPLLSPRRGKDVALYGTLFSLYNIKIHSSCVYSRKNNVIQTVIQIMMFISFVIQDCKIKSQLVVS